MIRHQWLGFGLATFLALQSGVGLVCQLNCRPVKQPAAAAASSGCHEQTDAENTAGAASIGVLAHSCDHFSAPATAPVVEKLHRPGTSFAAEVVAVTLFPQAAQRSIQPHDTHAPPSHSARTTDVLRV